MNTLCLLGLMALAGRPPAERIVLAQAGRPAATIVVPAKAPARLKQAAADLQTYVRKICGVELPLHADGKRVEGTGLYLGNCGASLPGDPPGADLNPESYAIRVRDESLFFAGRHPTPVAFAVDSFLEDQLGVRWFAPGEAWEYVPTGTPGELAVEVSEVVSVPATSPRIWSGHQWVDSWKDWCLRNKAVQGEVVLRRNFQNFLNQVFPPEKCAATHPEYYPLIDGKRWIPAAGDRYWRPCESNPDVIRLTAEFANQWFEQRPLVDSFSVGMDDIAHLCGCPNCRALDPHPDSYEKREFSDRHYRFVNAIAREIGKTHPERYVGTLIYAIARTPPETVPRLEDNVFGYLTETSALWWDEARREADHAITRAWVSRCQHVSRYDYYGLGTLTPRYYPHHMAEQIKFDKSLGLEGMYVEVYTFLPHTAPMIWALAKLQWDPSLDIDALLGEFMTKLFGRAAPTMARYWNVLEDGYNHPTEPHGWEHRNIVSQALAMSPAALDEGLALLDQAAGQADTELVRKRIDTVRAALLYSSYPIRAYHLSREIVEAPLDNAAEADALRDKVSTLLRQSSEREATWTAALARDDLLGETVRGLSGHGYLVTGRASTLEHGAVLGALRLLDWCAREAPGQLPELVAGLRQAAPGGPAAGAVNAWLTIQEQHPPNLAVNPGFEQEGANTEAAQHDWRTEGAPPGWSTWSRLATTAFAVEPGQGRDGGHGATIRKADSAVFLQTHPAQPGERYLFLAWARAIPEGKPRAAHLTLRFQKPDGAWHERRDLEPTVESVTAPGWQPLLIYVTVPEGAGKLVLMLGSSRQTGDEAVAYDDVALYRLPLG